MKVWCILHEMKAYALEEIVVYAYSTTNSRSTTTLPKSFKLPEST